MSQAKRLSTHKQYNSYLIPWFSYCENHSLSPSHASVQQGLSFLESLRHTRNLTYSATNTARSALSSILQTPDGYAFGQHPFVKLYLKGVFNSNPPVPKYTDTWDPSIVLKLLKTWSPPETIDLKTLTLKVGMLILLVTGQRIQTLAALDIDNMCSSSSSFIFRISSLLKQSRPGFTNPTVRLQLYEPDCRLCIYTYLTEYLKRTQELRHSESALLLTYKGPHHRASKDTMARWVRTVLDLAGINTRKYGPHSVRSASVSAAKRGGAKVQDILDTAGWTSSNTFAKYYDRTVDNTVSFDVAVLDN